jgi:hypothetical protein
MKVDDKLAQMYDGYYADGAVRKKREITARQTVDHIKTMLNGERVPSLIDIGAGDGAVLAELDCQGISEELHAVEISSSGCASISARSLPRVRSVRQFDGYKIEDGPGTYALGIAIHVLEHVEHERIFLNEIGRICNRVYVEVPLELTLRTERAITKSGPFGHINFYTPATFGNLLKTSDLEVLDLRIFSNSLDYEMLLGGRLRGRLKHGLRTSLLRTFPSAAPFLMTYLAGALCARRH